MLWGGISWAQINSPASEPFPAEAQSPIVFRDTVFGLAFDSLRHNLGTIAPVNVHLTQHFKYLGKPSVSIRKAWTGDPHFISRYPTDTLVYGQVYPFVVSFSHRDRAGFFNKNMGFILSTGETIVLNFKGQYTEPYPKKE
jgi:hypothetical protein